MRLNRERASIRRRDRIRGGPDKTRFSSLLLFLTWSLSSSWSWSASPLSMLLQCSVTIVRVEFACSPATVRNPIASPLPPTDCVSRYFNFLSLPFAFLVTFLFLQLTFAFLVALSRLLFRFSLLFLSFCSLLSFQYNINVHVVVRFCIWLPFCVFIRQTLKKSCGFSLFLHILHN